MDSRSDIGIPVCERFSCHRTLLFNSPRKPWSIKEVWQLHHLFCPPPRPNPRILHVQTPRQENKSTNRFLDRECRPPRHLILHVLRMGFHLSHRHDSYDFRAVDCVHSRSYPFA